MCIRDRINVNNNKIYDDVAANATKPDELKKDFIVESGIAKGIDFALKFEYKQYYLWAVYSLGYVCLLYTSDAADERSSVALGGRRLIKKKTDHNTSVGAAR